MGSFCFIDKSSRKLIAGLAWGLATRSGLSLGGSRETNTVLPSTPNAYNVRSNGAFCARNEVSVFRTNRKRHSAFTLFKHSRRYVLYLTNVSSTTICKMFMRMTLSEVRKNAESKRKLDRDYEVQTGEQRIRDLLSSWKLTTCKGICARPDVAVRSIFVYRAKRKTH